MTSITYHPLLYKLWETLYIYISQKIKNDVKESNELDIEEINEEFSEFIDDIVRQLDMEEEIKDIEISEFVNWKMHELLVNNNLI